MWLKHVLFWPYELMEWLLTPRVETAVMAAVKREKAEKTIDRIVDVENWLRRVGLDYVGLGGGGVLALGPFVWHMLTGTLSDADLGAVLAKYAYGTMFGLIGIVIISTLLLARCRQDRSRMMLTMLHGPWLGGSGVGRRVGPAVLD